MTEILLFRVVKFAMRVRRVPSLLGLACVLGLSACTGLPKADKPEITKSEAAENKDKAAQLFPKFPTLENKTEGLDSSLLYDLLLSNLAFQAGEFDIATLALLHAAKDSSDPLILSRAVRMAIHNKDASIAAELGRRWLSLSPEDHQASILTSLAEVLSNQEERAFGILKNLLAQSPENTVSYFRQIGEVFLQHAKTRPTQNLVKRLASLYPDLIEAWIVLAGVAQSHQDLPLMQEALDNALALEPDNQQAASYKLSTLKAEEKTQFAESFLKLNPEAHDMRLQYARILLAEEKNDKALKHMLIALKHQPESIDALNVVALLYQSRKEYANAAKYFSRQLKLAQDDDRIRLYLANAWQQLKHYDEAKVILAEVSDSAELFSAQRQMLGLIESADSVDDALEYWRTLAAKNAEESAQLIIDKQLILRRAKRTEEALTVLNEGLQKYPEENDLRYHRALLVLDQKDLIAHETDMRILLAKEPENAQYYNSLGYTLLTMTGRLEEAGRLINQAYALKPKDAYILDSKGWLYFKQGDFNLAIEFLNRAFELDQDAEIAAHLGEVYWQKGDQKRAKDFWKQGDEIDAKNESLLKTKARFIK